MKVIQVNYDDNEDIKDITVKMSNAEAAAIAHLAGQMNGHAHDNLKLKGEDSLYEALTDVFNRHYEDGVPNLGVTFENINWQR